MAQVTRMIDATSTMHHDYDNSQIFLSILGNKGGVLDRTGTDFDIVGNQLSPGTAIVKCIRSTSVAPFSSVEFLAVFYSTDTETVDISNGRKIYIEIDDSLVQDPALIQDIVPATAFTLGLGIGSIKSTASYPSHTNYIKLYEVDGGGVVNDVREKAGIDIGDLDLSTYTGDINGANLTVTGTASIDTLNVTTPPNFPVGTQVDGVNAATLGNTSEAVLGTSTTKGITIADAANIYGYSIIAGTDFTLVNSVSADSITSSIPTLLKEIVVDKGGVYTVTFDLQNLTGFGSSSGQIYVNGTAVGSLFSNSATNATLDNGGEDITVPDGGLLQIFYNRSSTRVSFGNYIDVKYGLQPNFLTTVTHTVNNP